MVSLGRGRDRECSGLSSVGWGVKPWPISMARTMFSARVEEMFRLVKFSGGSGQGMVHIKAYTPHVSHTRTHTSLDVLTQP